MLIDLFDGGELLFSQNYACPDCGVSIEALAPRMFSFNSPFGACPDCSGLGTILRISVDNLIPDRSKSLNQGALQAMAWNLTDSTSWARSIVTAVFAKRGYSMDVPVRELPPEAIELLMNGAGQEKFTVRYEGANGFSEYATTFDGVIPTLTRRYNETTSEAMKTAYEECMVASACDACHGRRLKPEILAVTIGGKNISDVSDLSVTKARAFFRDLRLNATERMIATPILREIDARLGFLDSVGLNSLTLSRAAATLSGGEAQRIRLEPICVASRMRCASPPDSVAAARDSVR